MPFVVLKRSDIPNSTLQLLDLVPNAMNRNILTDPPAQSKYVNTSPKDLVAVRGTAPQFMHRAAKGLAAWFLTNVGDGPIVQATGSITVANVPVDGDTVTINGVVLTARAAPSTPTEFLIGGDEPSTAANLAATITGPLSGLNGVVVAGIAGNVVALNAGSGFLGSAGNAITLASSVPGDLVLSGATLTGGVSPAPLTAGEANAMAAAIYDNIVRYGSSDPALPATLAAINAEIAGVVATASISVSQLADVLNILAGKVYSVPKDIQIANGAGELEVVPGVGQPGGPSFDEFSIRNTYKTGALNISVGEGELSKFTSADFVYRNELGAALVVYDDDGEIFVPGPL